MQPESISPKQPRNTTSAAENAREGIALETGTGPELEAAAGRQEIRNATAASAMGKRRGFFGSFPEFGTLGGLSWEPLSCSVSSWPWARKP